MADVTHKRSPDEPPGGWLGPCTTGWNDLPEVDLPAHLRPSLGPVKGSKR